MPEAKKKKQIKWDSHIWNVFDHHSFVYVIIADLELNYNYQYITDIFIDGIHP